MTPKKIALLTDSSADLRWIYTPRRGSTHEEKAGGTPDNGG